MAERVEQEEIFSQVLRAGRRFTHDDGSFHYQKHKIYLYKEDFAEFNDMLKAATDFIVTEKGEEVISERHQKDYKKEDVVAETEETPKTESFTDVSFDDI